MFGSLAALYIINLGKKAQHFTVERRRIWLVAINNRKYDVNPPTAKLVVVNEVCSKHFIDDDCERDIQSEMMGTHHKRKLKNTAVCSVFPWSGSCAVPKHRGTFEMR